MEQQPISTNFKNDDRVLLYYSPSQPESMISFFKRYFERKLKRFEEQEDDLDDGRINYKTMVDHAWEKRLMQLVSNKAQLMESFAWLSTVGGGFSALGERDSKFSYKAGALSVGQQLHLAELLGDDRLKVMCHLFFALASLQMGNKKFCVDYCSRVIVPLLNKLPFKDVLLSNMLRHIIFRVKTLDKFKNIRALEG